MVITSELVPVIVGVAGAIFAFGFVLGHVIGRRDGEDTVADYYAGKTGKRRRLHP